MEWSTACPGWEKRILAGESLVPVAPLFPQEADASLAILRGLHLKDVAGCPTIGEVCRPWILDFAAAIFGSYDAEAGRRLIPEFFLCVSKKNSKSTIAASIMLTALLRNWREDAELVILAPTVEAATGAFKPAASMVREDPELSALLDVRDYQRLIKHLGTNATLRVIAADSETVAGSKASYVLIDELWLFGKKANADSMLIEATGGLASRPEGFVIYLSTQSDAEPSGVFKAKLDYARAVRDGVVVDPKFMPVIYEFPASFIKSKKYKDPEFWYVTNPNLGASVDETFIERKIAQAEMGVEPMLDVLAKHLNVQIGVDTGGGWSGAEFWQKQEIVLSFADLLKRSEVITFGIDGGGLDDLLGLCAIGRERGTGHWLAWFHAWAHRYVFERRKSIAAQLQDFADDKELTIVEKPGQDVAQVAQYVKQALEAGLLPEENAIGVDQAGIGAILKALRDCGVDEKQIIGIKQGGWLNGAIKTVERMLAGLELFVAQSALMRWCVGNAKPELKGSSTAITKAAAGTAKIDPLAAMFDAAQLMELNPVAKKTRDFQFFVIG